QVNSAMVTPLAVTAVTSGEETWVGLNDVAALKPGQKIDFDGDTGIQITDENGQAVALSGTFLVAEIDSADKRVRLVDTIHRNPVASSGTFNPAASTVSTYKLVGPVYFLFFAGLGGVAAVVFIFVAGFYRERTHVRPEG